MPIDGKITSPFGIRTAPTAGATTFHSGIDISAKLNTPVKAALSGTVVGANYSSGMGNYVTIDHGDGISSIYKHLSKFTGTIGQKVNEGQIFALSGNTGVSTGPHLDFTLMQNGKAINPLTFTKEKSVVNAIGLPEVDTSGLLGIAKTYWWAIAGGLVILAILK